MPIGAVIGAGVIGAGAQMFSASKAAKAQTAAADKATAFQRDVFGKTQQNLAPFIAGGGQAFDILQMLTGSGAGGDPTTAFLTKPFAPTMETLEGTPGYKFALDQGLKAAQSGFAAQGLGSSGAALKGGTQFAKDLASTTFQQMFANDLSTKRQIFDMLMGQSTLGANAAAGQGTIGAQTGASVGQNMIGAGNAQAGAWMAGGNAIAGAGNNIANMYMQNNLIQRLLSNQGMGGGPTYAGAMGSGPFNGVNYMGYA